MPKIFNTLKIFNQLKITTRLWFSFSLLILAIIGLGSFAMFQMHNLATTTVKQYYYPYTINATIREVTINLKQMRIHALTIALATDNTTLDSAIAAINTLKNENQANFALIKERFLEDPQEVEALVAQSNKLDELREAVLKTLKTSNKEQAIQLLLSGEDAKQYDEVARHLKNITNYSEKTATTFMKNAQLQATTVYRWTSSVIVATIILAIWMAMMIARAINRPLTQAVAVANAITTGNFNNHIEVTSENEIGQILSALSAMQIQLRERLDEDKRITEDINMVTQAASQGDFGKRIALENKTGTFKILGDSINEVLEINQLAIKDLMRVFSAMAQGDLTKTITNQYFGELAQLKQDANTTVQRLTEVTEEINIVTHAASQGDFSKRIHLETKTGTFRLLGESINQVLDYNQSAIKDLTRVFSAVAQGNLTETITNQYAGEFAQLKQDANATVQKLTTVTEEIGIATRTASQGDFSKRINLENKTGTFRQLGESINQVLDYNQSAIKDLTRVFSAVAQGNLTETITNQYVGELAQLKQDANATVQKLTTVTEEIGIATRTASQGDFSKRIHLENKTGTFRQLGESINQVLDYNQSAIKDLTRVFSAVAQGNLTETITNQYAGEFAQLKQDANATVQKLTTVTEEIGIATRTASQGDFSKRINLENKTGTFRQLGESINQVLDYNQSAIKDLTRVFSAVAQGNLTETITNQYVGELAQLKQDANATVQKLTTVTEEIGIATYAASKGDFSKRIHLENKTGTFRILGESINQVLDYNQSAIKDLTRVFSAVAQGNLTETITNQYAGELAQLKQDANATVQKLTVVTEEIAEVTHAASQGDFSKRIVLEKKTGTFRILGESINQVLDYNQLAIKDLMRVFSSVVQGDLTQIITNDYSGELAQLKHDANATVAKLKEVLMVIKQSSEVVSGAAEEISQANANLSQRATQQAASLEETAASMEQMTGTVQQNADNARQANQLATTARERAEVGNQVVSAAVVAINEISRSSKKISEIISVIDEIAFQTNLLALNAAVEAARAGEHGRGFAVVASEVRTLAQRSATAAKEIKTLIQDSNIKVDEGTRLANQSGQTLAEIVVAVKKVNDIIAEIAAASTEQSQGIAQVNKAITQMDETVEQNSALVEQTASASESMRQQSQNLLQQVAFFNMNESVGGSPIHSRPLSPNPPSKPQSIAKNLPPQKAAVTKKPAAVNKGDWVDF